MGRFFVVAKGPLQAPVARPSVGFEFVQGRGPVAVHQARHRIPASGLKLQARVPRWSRRSMAAALSGAAPRRMRRFQFGKDRRFDQAS